MLRKRGTFNFFVPLTEVSQNFQEGNEAQLTHYTTVPFDAPSKRVGGPGAIVCTEGRQYGQCLGAELTLNPGLPTTMHFISVSRFL